jgi:hypothetical protein
MLINLKTAIFIFFFINISYAELIDINRLNRYIYNNIEYSADIEHYPSQTDIAIKKNYLKENQFDPKIKFIDEKILDDKAKLNIHENLNLTQISPTNRFGFTNKRTDIKMYPTESSLHHNKNDVIDRNQFSLIEPFEPVVIIHTSLDKKWYFIQTYYTRGWTKSSDINEVNYTFFLQFFNMPKLSIIADRINISNFTFGFGSKVPLLQEYDTKYVLLLPNNEQIEITQKSPFVKYPARYDPMIAKNFLESVIGQPYDWGGKNGYRDCSSLVMDLFRIFGINLPRNSKQQARIGITLWENGNIDSFFETLSNADPYCTFIHMKGHIIIYGGKSENDYIIYHAVEKLNGITYNSVIKQKILSDNTYIWEKAYKITTICQYKEKQSY